MSKDDMKQLAQAKAEQLNKLLQDLESGIDTTAAAEKMGANRLAAGEKVEIPIGDDTGRFAAISCSGCGCFCFSFAGTGHGCGTHAGHWA